MSKRSRWTKARTSHHPGTNQEVILEARRSRSIGSCTVRPLHPLAAKLALVRCGAVCTSTNRLPWSSLVVELREDGRPVTKILQRLRHSFTIFISFAWARGRWLGSMVPTHQKWPLASRCNPQFINPWFQRITRSAKWSLAQILETFVVPWPRRQYAILPIWLSPGYWRWSLIQTFQLCHQRYPTRLNQWIF